MVQRDGWILTYAGIDFLAYPHGGVTTNFHWSQGDLSIVEHRDVETGETRFCAMLGSGGSHIAAHRDTWEGAVVAAETLASERESGQPAGEAT